jgi:hypothetical protein
LRPICDKTGIEKPIARANDPRADRRARVVAAASGSFHSMTDFDSAFDAAFRCAHELDHSMDMMMIRVGF